MLQVGLGAMAVEGSARSPSQRVRAILTGAAGGGACTFEVDVDGANDVEFYRDRSDAPTLAVPSKGNVDDGLECTPIDAGKLLSNDSGDEAGHSTQDTGLSKADFA